MTNRWLWAVVAVLAVCLTACSKNDEPEPQPNPDTEQEDPNTTSGDQSTEQEENWGDEKPHGFYFDIDSIYIPLTEDGFLRVWDQYHKNLCDAIVMENRYKRPSKDNRSKGGILYGTTGERASLRLIGKKANPWVNVDKYIEMCQTIHLRPDSKFSDFPELEGLPLGNVQLFGLMTLETLVNVDVISHKYFCAEIPAGGSMRGPEDLSQDPYVVYSLLECINGEYIFKEMQKGPYVVGGPGPYSMLRMGKCNTKYIMSSMELWFMDYPDQAGDYPMTLRMEFASGKVLTKEFKIRFVDEK